MEDSGEATATPNVNMEEFLRAFMTALQRVQPGNSSYVRPIRRRSPSPSESSPESQLEAATTWEDRVWRMDPSGRPGMTQRRFAELEAYQKDGGDLDDAPSALVYEQRVDERTKIQVNSKRLNAAIAAVDKHPPLQPQHGSFTEFEPYPTLFYHLEDVRREIEALNDPDALVDFQTLEFVAREVAPLWNEARNVDIDSGFIQYNMIWRLFHAGDLVIRKDELGNDWLLVLIEVKEIKDVSRTSRGIVVRHDSYTEFVVWGLTWDGVEDRLKRKVNHFRLRPYTGSRSIFSLPVWPLKALQGDKDAFLRSMAARGKLWWNLIGTPTSCLQYDGPAYKGEVAIQPRGYIERVRETDKPERTKLEDRVIIDRDAKRTVVWNAIGEFDAPNGGYYRREYNELTPAEVDARPTHQWDSIPATQALTDEQAMLCPPLIGCYNIKTTEVFTVSVDKLRPVQWNSEAMKHLVLDPAKKEMLRGLISRHYNHTLNRQGGDLIEGKGEGLVVLLHGPPGVGKTLTAESLAEIVQKPLIALSVGDLIWDEMQLQRRLQTEFQRAINWDAILLLDEADVVLEARSFEDVRRNGIVSVFLRQLEYYRGVLFLTTNRLNTMDAAFESRIQVGIGFKDLTDDIRQQIWTKLLHIKGYEGVVGLKVLQRLSRAKLNGRQIRNVLNVAEGYAFNEYSRQGCMEERHVLEAVKATLEFQQYLEKAKSNTKLEQSVWAPYRGDNDL